MARIVITSRLTPHAVDLLEATDHEVFYRDEPSPMPRAELLVAVATADALVSSLADRIDAELLANAPSLQVVANVAVGLDNIDLAHAAAQQIVICNTPGVLDAATADVAIFLMLAARRRTTDREAELREGRWQGWGIAENLALDLSGSVLGLVGYGRIAQAVARRARAFDMDVLHHTRHDTGEPGWVADVTELAGAVDVLSLHVPLTSETAGLISASVLGAMKSTAVVINTARGAVLDEEALAEALEKGKIFGAGLDVYQGEPSVNLRLLRAPHTVLLPHIGSATEGTRRAMCEVALRSVLSVLAGELPENRVN